MTSFDWDVLTIGLTTGLGLGLSAMVALRLHASSGARNSRNSTQQTNGGGSMWWRLTNTLSAPRSENATHDSRQLISETDGGR